MNTPTLLALLSCATLLACAPEAGGPQQGDEETEADTDTADSDEGNTSVELDNEHDGYLGALAPEECTERGYAIPFDDEKGWWSATAMSANDRDVVIDSVRYEIVDECLSEGAADANCAVIDHRVAVYIGGATPSETPTRPWSPIWSRTQTRTARWSRSTCHRSRSRPASISTSS